MAIADDSDDSDAESPVSYSHGRPRNRTGLVTAPHGQNQAFLVHLAIPEEKIDGINGELAPMSMLWKVRRLSGKFAH